MWASMMGLYKALWGPFMWSRILKVTLPRVIKDELPSENSPLTIFMRTVNSYWEGKTTRGDGDSLSSQQS